jgi:molecular chaperone GrpE
MNQDDLLHQAQEREKRALADYQNLVRRNQEERSRLLKFANKELIESLMQPISHLSIAAQQIKDKGLDMVVQDFRKVLEEAGLEEINPEGEAFDIETMEVIDKEGKGETVIKVVKPGYKLNGEVIQHAKVIVG